MAFNIGGHDAVETSLRRLQVEWAELRRGHTARSGIGQTRRPTAFRGMTPGVGRRRTTAGPKPRSHPVVGFEDMA